MAWLQGFCKFNITAENISPLLQLLGINATGAKLNLEILETDLAVIPLRSLGGITWLGEYCRETQTLPGSEKDDL